MPKVTVAQQQEILAEVKRIIEARISYNRLSSKFFDEHEVRAVLADEQVLEVNMEVFIDKIASVIKTAFEDSVLLYEQALAILVSEGKFPGDESVDYGVVIDMLYDHFNLIALTQNGGGFEAIFKNFPLLAEFSETAAATEVFALLSPAVSEPGKAFFEIRKHCLIEGRCVAFYMKTAIAAAQKQIKKRKEVFKAFFEKEGEDEIACRINHIEHEFSEIKSEINTDVNQLHDEIRKKYFKQVKLLNCYERLYFQALHAKLVAKKQKITQLPQQPVEPEALSVKNTGHRPQVESSTPLASPAQTLVRNSFRKNNVSPTALQQKSDSRQKKLMALFSDESKLSFQKLKKLVEAFGGKVENKGGSKRRIVLHNIYADTHAVEHFHEVHAKNQKAQKNKGASRFILEHFRAAFTRAGLTPEKLWPDEVAVSKMTFKK